ncbi:MAG: aldo/keto reductase [Chloroflexi bacterium]|nr:aldo/keto reductase [Chloroflexota bacterium]
MRTKQLGKSDLQITPVGFGAWAIGGSDWAYTWGPQDDKESIEAIHRALDHGVNWIDTAPIYGLGHSEEVVAQALKTSTHKPYVFTKCGRLWDEQGQISSVIKAESIRREIEGSLKRLGVECIDLYQMHWPNPDPDIEEGWSTLSALKAEGKIRWAGVSNFNAAQLERASRIAPVISLQPPYSLIRRGVEDSILPYCLDHQIGVIVYSPMQAGLLSGAMSHERIEKMDANDWRRKNPEFQEPHFSRNLGYAALLTKIGLRYGVAAGVVAIAWTLHHPAVTGAIVGSRSAAQVDGIVPAALDFQLSPADYAEINAYATAHP